jgi:hypothetical protein
MQTDIKTSSASHFRFTRAGDCTIRLERASVRFPLCRSSVTPWRLRMFLWLLTSLYQIPQILSLTLFKKTSTSCTLQSNDLDADLVKNVNQLDLYEF